MPRKAPSLEGGVLEHRLTFGDLERKAIMPLLEAHEEVQKAKRFNERAQGVTSGIKAAALVGVAGGACFLVFTSYTLFKSIGDWMEAPLKTVTDTIGDVKNGIWGLGGLLWTGQKDPGAPPLMGAAVRTMFTRWNNDSLQWEAFNYDSETRTWAWVCDTTKEQVNPCA